MRNQPDYRTRSLFIASLSPLDLPVVGRPYGFYGDKKPILDRHGNETGVHSYGGWVDYTIKGVGFDHNAAPNVIEIEDGFQHGRDVFTKGQAEAAQFVDAEVIVADLLLHWQQGLSGSPFGLPVWKCSSPRPPEAEVEEQRNKLMEYCRWLYNEGNRLSAEHKHANIHPLHRMGGIYLNRNDDWLRAYRVDDRKVCPFCGSNIDPRVYICKACGNVAREIPAELLALNPQLRAPQVRHIPQADLTDAVIAANSFPTAPIGKRPVDEDDDGKSAPPPPMPDEEPEEFQVPAAVTAPATTRKGR